MKTISAEEFKKKFGAEGEAMFKHEISQPGYFSKVADQVKGNISEASRSLDASASGQMNPLAAGANIAKNVSGAVLAPVAQVLKPIFDKTVTPISDAIVGTQPAQRLIDVLSKHPELVGAIADTLETGINVAGIEGTISQFKSGINFVKKVANGKTGFLPENVPPLEPPPGSPPSGLQNTANDTSAGIMNRVARLNPSEETAFNKMSGKTPGQYLQETGNFGAPDEIIKTESAKFLESKNMVDAEMAKLPGIYQDGSVADALSGLKAKAESVSTGNVKAPYLDQVNQWLNKYKSGGLTMEEINAVKRLYERQVKLGYNKLMNAEKVEQATNIDNALREWQVKQAKELGFNNVDALNKQTQISKFIIDKLGDKMIGQSALNSVSLTDWIVLGGGDISSIAGFLTKKFFSSKVVQAKIAEILNSKGATGIIKPDIGPSKVLKLPAPKTNVRSQTSGNTPIRVAPRGSRTEIINQ